MSNQDLKLWLDQIYDIVKKLEAKYPGRRFTPDGHMVGSIGEVLAEEKYEIELLPSNTKDHDAKTKDGRLIQIRTTQGRSAPLKKRPDNLIVQKLHPDGTVEEVFNGPGQIAWELTKNRRHDGNSQYNIPLGQYRKADKRVDAYQRIKRK